MRNNQSHQNLKDLLAIRCGSGATTTPELLGQLADCVEKNRIEILYSKNNRPIGYIAWARINKESFLILCRSKKMPPQLYEWNEGQLVIIHEVLAIPGWGKEVSQRVRKTLQSKRWIAFIKRDKIHLWFKHKGRFTQKIF